MLLCCCCLLFSLFFLLLCCLLCCCCFCVVVVFVVLLLLLFLLFSLFFLLLCCCVVVVVLLLLLLLLLFLLLLLLICSQLRLICSEAPAHSPPPIPTDVLSTRYLSFTIAQNDRIEISRVNSLLWTTLCLVPSIAVTNQKDILTYFFTFLERDYALLSEDTVEISRTEVNDRLCLYLELFTKFTKPTKLFESEKLKHILHGYVNIIIFAGIYNQRQQQ